MYIGIFPGIYTYKKRFVSKPIFVSLICMSSVALLNIGLAQSWNFVDSDIDTISTIQRVSLDFSVLFCYPEIKATEMKIINQQLHFCSFFQDNQTKL